MDSLYAVAIVSTVTPSSVLGPLFATAVPVVTTNDAELIAASLFGVVGSAHELAGERDRNFHIVEKPGAEWVLRVVHPEEDPVVTDLQTVVLEHIAHRDPTLPVPRVKDPDSRHDVELRDGRRCAVRLTSYVPGESLAHTFTRPADQAGQLGTIAGRLDAALMDLRHAGKSHSILWDTAAFISDDALLQSLVRPHEDLARALTPILDRLRAVLPTLPQQFVHNDLNPHNLIVDDAGDIIAVIDFGDLTWAPRVQDLAVASAYVAGGHDWRAALEALRTAYQARVPLTEDELSSLDDLTAARCIAAMAITRHRAEEHPGNADYILRNHDTTRLALARITGEAHD